MKKYIIAGILIFTFYVSNAHVSLIYPEGSESFSSGEIVNIQWEEVVAHNTINWDLYFSSDGGISWEVLQTDIPYSTLNYNWTVPEINTADGKIKIIQDNDGTDYEDICGNFTVDFGSTNINTDMSSLNPAIYPNPVTNNLFIRYDQVAEFRILSIIGKTVFEGRINRELTTVDVSGLCPGVYMIEIRHSGKSSIRKFIKK